MLSFLRKHQRHLKEGQEKLQLALGKKTFFRKLTKYQESQTHYKEHILASLTFRKVFS